MLKPSLPWRPVGTNPKETTEAMATEKRVLFVGHSADRSGAPILLLHLLRWLRSHGRLDMSLVLTHGGPLEEDYRALLPTTVISRKAVPSVAGRLGDLPLIGSPLRRAWRSYRNRSAAPAQDPHVLYVNTVASAAAARDLMGGRSIPLVAHVHELDAAIRANATADQVRWLASTAAHTLAASDAVRDTLVSNHGFRPTTTHVVPTFIDAAPILSLDRSAERSRIRTLLGIPECAVVVAGCGVIEHRKGTDLFVRMAESVVSSPAGSPVHFLWIGRNGADVMFVDEVRRAAGPLTESGRMHFAGEQPITGPWFAAADIFVLPSREEPMGMVALEAATAGCAVACFSDAGGLPGVLGADGGLVVPLEDSAKLAEAVLALVVDGALRGSLARVAAHKVITGYDVGVAAPRILEFVEATACAAAP